MKPIKHSHNTINGLDLESTYGVYIILIKDVSGKPTHCNVGQTVDAKHISARPAFYHIAAHLGCPTRTIEPIFEKIRINSNEIPSLTQLRDTLLLSRCVGS